MYKSVIVDDENHCQLTLSSLLNEYFPDIKIIGTANGVSKGIDLIISFNPDIVFLDVEMQDGTGFDLIEKIPLNRYKIIFTTGHSKYAADAFKYSAIDYLLKPIEINALKAAIEKIKSTKFMAEMNTKIETLLSNRNGFEKVALPCHEGIEMVRINNIIRCESESNYTRFYFTHRKPILVTKVLKEYDAILSNQNFFRVHKSHLVNLNYIKKYVDGEGGYLIMEDDSAVNVSRRRKKLLMDMLLR